MDSQPTKVHSVKYNFIMNFILTASRFIFPLITFPYISRVLGVDANGRLGFAASVADYFLLVASLGIPTYGIRACASVRDDPEKLSKTVQEIFIINEATTILVILVYMLSVAFVPQFRNEAALFYIHAADIALNAIGVAWFYQAIEQYDYITMRTIACKVIGILLMFLLVHQKSDYVIYAAITVFTTSAANIINFLRLRKYVSFRKFKDYDFRQHMKPIMILFAQTLASAIYGCLDSVMLGFMRGNVEVGLYTIAAKLKMVLLALVTSLTSVLLPRMSYYVKNDDSENFDRMVVIALNFTTMMSIPLGVYFTLYSAPILGFIAGEEYLPAALTMALITLALIPIGITRVLGVQVLTAKGQEEKVLRSVIIGAIADFLLNLAWIPNYGAAGAAFATLITEIIVLIVQLRYTWGHIAPHMQEFSALKYVLWSVISGLISWLMFRSLAINASYFIQVLISGLSFFIPYLIGLFVTNDFAVRSIMSRFTKR